jgi:hypothetical protein
MPLAKRDSGSDGTGTKCQGIFKQALIYYETESHAKNVDHQYCKYLYWPAITFDLRLENEHFGSRTTLPRKKQSFLQVIEEQSHWSQ